jgi:glycosyltransferase involved in cell wall biosynthesis
LNVPATDGVPEAYKKIFCIPGLENVPLAVNVTPLTAGPVMLYSEADKAWYLHHCLAFMLPSLAEGFGAPVVEAMKFGKPLFLSNRTSLPEIGSDVAFYFNNFDPEHMHQVFYDGMFAYQQNGLEKKIIARGNDFNWEEKAKEYINIYRSLL